MKKILINFLMVLVFFASKDGATQSVARGIKSTTNVVTAGYDLYKTVARDFLLYPDWKKNPRKYSLHEYRRFEVGDCGYGDWDYNIGSMFTQQEKNLVDLARYITQLESDLTKVGYSHLVFKDLLSRFETEAQSEIAKKTWNYHLGHEKREELAGNIEKQRGKVQPDKLPIIGADGCGAGEVEVVIRFLPTSGSGAFINQFAFEVCRARGLDPWDTNRCLGWTPIANNKTLPLSGIYVYSAKWPDGRSAHGQQHIVPFKDGEVITISP